jgi:hypothetical protein
MMAYVIKLEGLAVGRPSEYDGEYLSFYDPGAGEPGECRLDTVADPREARHFATFQDAVQTWQADDPRQPVRADGKPNRPLTAYSVSIEPVT